MTPSDYTLKYLPPGMETCSLIAGSNPRFVDMNFYTTYEGNVVHASAFVKYMDGATETIEIKNNLDMCNFLRKWIGVPYYTHDEWVQIKAQEQDRLRREEAMQAIRKAEYEDRMRREKFRRYNEEQERERIQLERKRKLEEEAEQERLDPLLSIESIRKAIIVFFSAEARRLMYPTFRNDMLSVQRDKAFESVLHIKCSISLSKDTVFSPLYPNATEVCITNRWVYPESRMIDHIPKPDPARCVLKPGNINVLPEADVRSLDRISHLLQCMQYLFPIGESTRVKIKEIKDQTQAEGAIPIHCAHYKQRIQQMIRDCTRKMVTELVAELKQTYVDICTPTGTNEQLSVVAACDSLQLNIKNEISDSIRYSTYSLQSSLGKSDTFQILSTADRFFDLVL